MFDFRGIYYQMISNCFIAGIVCLLFLLDSRFWMKDKIVKEKLWVSIGCGIVFIFSTAYYLHVLNNPKIEFCEGYFEKEYREDPFLLRKEYDFSGCDTYLESDAFSKKELFPEGFAYATKYRVYYEDSTKVIVKIEKIE